MRSSKLIILSSLLLAGAGGALLVMRETTIIQTDISKEESVNVPKFTGNPLLSADKELFKKWTKRATTSCGAELYANDKQGWGATGCVELIIGRVKEDTGITLTAEEVINPSVKQHWQQVIRR